MGEKERKLFRGRRPSLRIIRAIQQRKRKTSVQAEEEKAQETRSNKESRVAGHRTKQKMLSDEAGQTHHQIYILKDYVLPIKNKTHMNNIQPFNVNRTLKTYKGSRFRFYTLVSCLDFADLLWGWPLHFCEKLIIETMDFFMDFLLHKIYLR